MPICIDTEGAQIRTKVKKSRKYREKEKLSIFKNKGNFKIYPPKVFEKIKKNDFLSIGFDTLKVRVAAVNSKKIYGEILEEGLLANNMGVHLINRKIKLNFITEKDKKANANPLEKRRGFSRAGFLSFSKRQKSGSAGFPVF